MVEYREILEFPGYRVGNDGSVWSRRKQISEKGRQGFVTIFTKKWHRVPIWKCHGYLYVTLTHGPLRKGKRIHVLVLEHFVGPRPIGKESRHANGIRADNQIDNLSWATHKENEQDKYLHGTRQKAKL